MRLTISPVGQFGLVADVSSYELPNNAWNVSENIRFKQGKATKFHGSARISNPVAAWDPVYGEPLALFGFSADTTAYWVVGTEFALVASAEAGRTTLGDGYTTNEVLKWNSAVLNGFAIFNNGNDLPQQWTIGDLLGTPPCTALVNWNTTWRAKQFHVYKDYLIALNITKTGTNYPTMVKWSHPADSGALPVTWDETDATKDAGEHSLGDGFDELLDGETMGDVMYLYRRRSIWGMQFVGGTFIFRFWQVFKDIGLLSPGCVVNIPMKQFFIGSQGFFVQDGQSYKEVGEDRIKAMFFAEVNQNKLHMIHLLHNDAAKEVWVLYPANFSDTCNKILVWNYNEDTWTTRGLTTAVLAANVGRLPATFEDSWAAGENWNSNNVPWDVNIYYLSGYKPVLLDENYVIKAYEVGTSEDTADFTATLTRNSMSLPSKADKPIDLGDVKFISRIWPKITGTAGGVVNVYVGSQMQIDEDVVWSGPFPYTIGTTKDIPCRVSGRLISLKFTDTSSTAWQMQSLQLEYEPMGLY
jgi:hypothetical protein